MPFLQRNNAVKRDLLTLADVTPDEIGQMLTLAKWLNAAGADNLTPDSIVKEMRAFNTMFMSSRWHVIDNHETTPVDSRYQAFSYGFRLI